jgi:uncharacterized membrane protein YqjE
MSEQARSVPELLGDIVNQLSTLVRKEIQLARAELGEKTSNVTGALPGIGIGAALLLGALIMVLFSAADGVARLLDIAAGWGLLIVGVAAGLIGYLLIRGALSRLQAANLVPQRTAEQLSRDAQMAKEQVR